MSVIPSGSNCQCPAGQPTTLSGLLLSRIDRNRNSRLIEINQAGERDSQTTAQLYVRSLEILGDLRKCASASESDIVLCFESVLDFIPAAWACICGGYSWMAWRLPKLSSDKAIYSSLDLLGRKLDNPVLLATCSISRRIA